MPHTNTEMNKLHLITFQRVNLQNQMYDLQKGIETYDKSILPFHSFLKKEKTRIHSFVKKYKD